MEWASFLANNPASISNKQDNNKKWNTLIWRNLKAPELLKHAVQSQQQQIHIFPVVPSSPSLENGQAEYSAQGQTPLADGRGNV